MSLLGIRVSVDDAAVLGSAVLFVMSLWLFLVARRENHTIGLLLRHTDTPHPTPDGQSSTADEVNTQAQRWLIFHTILANSLFVTCDPYLARITSLRPALTAKESAFGECNAWINRVAFAFVRYFFFSFPVITCAVVFGLDRWSYFIADPFARGFEPAGVGPFFWRSMGVFLFCWVPLAICCWRSSQYSRATEMVLREYGRRLGADLLADEHLPSRRIASEPVLRPQRDR